MHSRGTPTREKIVETLRLVGADGLKTVALLRKVAIQPGGKRPTKEVKAALEHEVRQTLASLETAGEVVNFGTAKTPSYILAEFDRRMDWACETLERRETPGRATLYNAAALRKGHRKGVTRDLATRAIAQLVHAGRLIEVHRGSAVYYLHAGSVLPLISPGLRTAAAGDIGRSEPISSEAIRTAYDTLAREIGFADVPIADLHGRTGMPLEPLQTWLREESRAGRAVPTRGDWSLAGDTARAAALLLRGEPHLQIRLL